MIRTKTFLALALVIALTATGCAVETKRATNVTTSSATLGAEVQCSFEGAGVVWWELREAGSSNWSLVNGERDIACERGGPDTIQLSNTVTGLQAGVTYEYRLGMDPAPAGGPLVYTASTRFTTGRFSPGLVSSADHRLSATAAKSLGADAVSYTHLTLPTTPYV